MLHEDMINDFKSSKIDIYKLISLLYDKNDVSAKDLGVVYTPKYIADYILNLVDPNLDEIILEPSVGHGVFLFSLISFMENKYNLSKNDLRYWFENKIIANDINNKTIMELKLLLNIFFEKKDIKNIKTDNIFTADSLFYNYDKVDCVIGNPPYVRTSNIDTDYLLKLRHRFKSCSRGNIDIYYAFLEKFHNISKRFSFIVPNGYITNKSAKTLRSIIFDNVSDIIDFKEKLIFKDARVYTSIFLIRSENSNTVNYSNDINEKMLSINKKDLDDNKWLFNRSTLNLIISKEEFNRLSFISGIATLKDSLYILKYPQEKGDFYIKEYNGVDYLIEKNICVECYKLTKLDEKSVIIYPYDGKNIINEHILSKKYPMAYKYLLNVKNDLDKRDKGKTDKYESWYAYGRKQGLNIKNNSFYLLLPNITNKKLDLKIQNKNSKFLITTGYCIESEDKDILNKVKDGLSSYKFFNFIKNEGKAWPGKNTYYTFSLKQLKKFINYLAV